MRRFAALYGHQEVVKKKGKYLASNDYLAFGPGDQTYNP